MANLCGQKRVQILFMEILGRRILVILFCVLFHLSLVAQTKFQAPVVKAELGLNGGWITQQIAVDLQRGINEIEIENIGNKNESSIMLLCDSPGVVINQFHFITPKPVVRFADSIKTLTDTLNNQKLKLSINQQSQRLLWDNRTIRVSDKSIYVDDLSELEEFMTERMLKLKKQQQSQERRISKTEATIKTLESKEYTLNQEAAERSSLSINVSAARALKTNIRIVYRTQLAYFTPEYHANFNTQTKQYALKLGAHLVNSTKLNWNNIQINLVDDKLDFERTDHIILNNFYIQGSFSIESGKKTFIYHKNILVDGDLNYVCSAIAAEESMIKANINNLYGLRLTNGELVLACDGNVINKQSISKPSYTDSISVIAKPAYGLAIQKATLDNKGKQLFGGKDKIERSYSLSISSELPFAINMVYTDRILEPNTDSKSVDMSGSKDVVLNEDGVVLYETTLLPFEKRNIEYGFKIKK
ncbi:MAG: DUF4139 domain-containing protein [Bacteroidetes bacterium]|nr:DUF4139 domain-containing protein [Bacteroidota bacterium]